MMESSRDKWELYMDEVANYPYWYNTETGESKWDTGYEQDEDDLSVCSPVKTDRAPMSPHHKNKKVIDTSLINRLFRKQMSPKSFKMNESDPAAHDDLNHKSECADLHGLQSTQNSCKEAKHYEQEHSYCEEEDYDRQPSYEAQGGYENQSKTTGQQQEYYDSYYKTYDDRGVSEEYQTQYDEAIAEEKNYNQYERTNSGWDDNTSADYKHNDDQQYHDPSHYDQLKYEFADWYQSDQYAQEDSGEKNDTKDHETSYHDSQFDGKNIDTYDYHSECNENAEYPLEHKEGQEYEEVSSQTSQQKLYLKHAWGEETPTTSGRITSQRGERDDQNDINRQSQQVTSEDNEDDWGDLSTVKLSSTSEKNDNISPLEPSRSKINFKRGLRSGRSSSSEVDSPSPAVRITRKKSGHGQRKVHSRSEYKMSPVELSVVVERQNEMSSYSTSPRSRRICGGENLHSHNEEFKVDAFNSRSNREHFDDVASPPSVTSSLTADSATPKHKVVVPALDMCKLRENQAQSQNKKRGQIDVDGACDYNGSYGHNNADSPTKKVKDYSFVNDMIESICDEKRTMQDNWESAIFKSDTSRPDIFDPRPPFGVEENDVSLLEIFMYLGCLDEMMDLYLAYPTDLFLQYVAQASEQYSIIMQANAMQREECIRVASLHRIFCECQIKYLVSIFDFSSAVDDASMIALLQTISVDDIIYKYPFVSYTAYTMSHPLPEALPEDQVAYAPSSSMVSKGESTVKGFWGQITWLFDSLNDLGINTYGQLMTYTTMTFQGHSLFSKRGEIMEEYVSFVLSKIGGSYCKALHSKNDDESMLVKHFLARTVLLSSPIKFDTYFYECCKHYLDDYGYRNYDQFGPSLGSYLLFTESEWEICISDVLQYIALGKFDQLPTFSTYYQLKR